METGNLTQKIKTHYQAWQQARQERHLINTINLELLEMFLQITAAHPELSSREHLNKMVMRYKGCDEVAAYEVMRIAEESYAAWPLERELTLCDVIHYLAVREFQAKQGDEFYAGSNIGASVRAVVPHRYCPVRLKQPYNSERRKSVRENTG